MDYLVIVLYLEINKLDNFSELWNERNETDFPYSFNHFNTMLGIKKQCYDIFRYLLIYFDLKNTLKIIYVSSKC